MSLSSVEGLGSLSETAGETVVHKSELQGTLEGVENGHLTLGSIAGNLNLLADLGGVVLFYVRLFRYSLATVSANIPPATNSQLRRIAQPRAPGNWRKMRRQRCNSPFWYVFLVGRSSKIFMCIKKMEEGGGLRRDLEVSSFGSTQICRNLNDRVRGPLGHFYVHGPPGHTTFHLWVRVTFFPTRAPPL